MGSRRNAASNYNKGGLESYKFTLYIRHRGRIEQSIPPKYLGGKIKSFSGIDSDEWGFITLKEKFGELGYKEDNFRFLSVVEDCLFELFSDNETSKIANSVIRPKKVEVWVIPSSDADDETIEEGYIGESEDDLVSVQEESSGSEYEVENETVNDLELEHGDGGFPHVNDELNLSDERPIIGSDVEVEKNVWDSVNPPINQLNVTPPTLWLGRTFKDKAGFKDAVQIYGVTNGKELKFIKNDKVRCVAECTGDGCKWKVTLRKDKDDLSWKITSFNDEHANCVWANENKMVTAALVAKRWRKEIASNSDWKMEEFRERACTTDHYHISKRQAYKAMTLARSVAQGEETLNFNRIWSYCKEIERTNPKTTCVVKLSDFMDENGARRLLRVYICWEACREGFKFCRPIIGVDGCHLRSKFGGMLLTAVSIDANDSLFPIAYAIVEGENKDSWTWFLQLLKRDLQITASVEQEFTLMSDKQKGLIPAFEEVLPLVSHRFCVRHLHGNMKLAGFTGNPIKDALWKAARATTLTTFNAALRELRGLNVEVFEWLADKHPSHWSRSHFSTECKSDMLVNNICESFNAMILDARKAPLLNCLEILRKQIMVRVFECRLQGGSWNCKICPTIVAKLSVFEKQAGGYWGYQSEEYLFEVKGAYDQHAVDLRARTCSCRKWQLTGIPCRHVICAIWLKRGKIPLFDYVDPCYSVESYLKTYALSIHPLSGPDEWPESDRQPPLPPLYTTKVGRPRKLRKKSAPELTKSAPKLSNDGVHVSRQHVKLHCRLCKQGGHNSRRCPQRRNMEPEIEAQREGQEAVNVQMQGQEAGNAQMQDHEAANAQMQGHEAGNEQIQGQEEIVIHTQPDVESETQADDIQVESGSTSLFEIPVESDDTLIEALEDPLVNVEADNTQPKGQLLMKARGNVQDDTTQPNGQLLMKAKGKQKTLGLPKKRTIMNRKYSTRSKLISKFSNTSKDPISLE